MSLNNFTMKSPCPPKLNPNLTLQTRRFEIGLSVPNLGFVVAKGVHPITLQGINISHLGKRKIIFKMPSLGDMLVPWRVFVDFSKSRFSLKLETIGGMADRWLHILRKKHSGGQWPNTQPLLPKVQPTNLPLPQKADSKPLPQKAPEWPRKNKRIPGPSKGCH